MQMNNGIEMPKLTPLVILKILGYILFSVFEWQLSGTAWFTFGVILFNNLARLLLTANVKTLAELGDGFTASQIRSDLKIIMIGWVIYLGLLIVLPRVGVTPDHIEAGVYFILIALTGYIIVLLDNMDSHLAEARYQRERQEKEENDRVTYKNQFEATSGQLDRLKGLITGLVIRENGRYYLIEPTDDGTLAKVPCYATGEPKKNGTLAKSLAN